MRHNLDIKDLLKKVEIAEKRLSEVTSHDEARDLGFHNELNYGLGVLDNVVHAMGVELEGAENG